MVSAFIMEAAHYFKRAFNDRLMFGRYGKPREHCLQGWGW